MSSGDPPKLETFLIVACRPLDSKQNRNGKPHKIRKLPFALFSRLVKQISIEQSGLKDSKLGRSVMVSIADSGKDLLFASGTDILTMMDYRKKKDEPKQAGTPGIIKSDPRIIRLVKPDDILPYTGLLQKLLLVRDELLIRISSKVLDIVAIKKEGIQGEPSKFGYSWERVFHLEGQDILRASTHEGLSDFKDRGVAYISSPYGVDTMLLINGTNQLTYLNIWTLDSLSQPISKYAAGTDKPESPATFAANENTLARLTTGKQLIEVCVSRQIPKVKNTKDNNNSCALFALDATGDLSVFVLRYQRIEDPNSTYVVPVICRADGRDLPSANHEEKVDQDLRLAVVEDFRTLFPEATVESFTTFVAHNDYLLVATEYSDENWTHFGNILSLYSISDIFGAIAHNRSKFEGISTDSLKGYRLLPKSVLNFESDSTSRIVVSKIQPIPLLHQGKISRRKYELGLFLTIGSGADFSVVAVWETKIFMVSRKLRFESNFPFLSNSLFYKYKGYWQGVICLGMEIGFIAIHIKPQ